MNNAKLRLMGLLLTNSVFCLTAAMGMEQKSERKFVWTTIGRYVNAETNNKLTDQEFIGRARSLINNQRLVALHTGNQRLDALHKNSTISKILARNPWEDFLGNLRSTSEIIRAGYKESPVIVGGIAIVAGAVGAPLGYVAGLKLAAYYVLEGSSVAAGLPPGTVTYCVAGTGAVVTALGFGYTGASIASWAVLNDEEFNDAYVRGYNIGVKTAVNAEKVMAFKLSIAKASFGLFTSYAIHNVLKKFKENEILLKREVVH